MESMQTEPCTTSWRKLGDYFLGRKLGSGQYSKVREGERCGEKYAVKYMDRTLNPKVLQTCVDLVLSEVKVMEALNHPNIVRLHDFSDKGVIEKSNGKTIPVLYLALDLITGGELFDYVAVSGSFSDKVARFYFKQLIDAIEFMHTKGFAHRDIKAENLLIDSDYRLKLVDFGFSTPMGGKDGSGKLHTAKGTEGYMAPEILNQEPYSGEKVDLFAAGVLLFIMVAQHPPFRRASPTDGFYKMFCQRNDLFWTKMSNGKLPNTFSPEFKALVNSLMAFEPQSRPSIQDIKQSAWYNGPIITPEELISEFARRKAVVEEDWKVKAAEALAKKKAEKITGGFLCGIAPHPINTKSSMPVEETAILEVKKLLPLYKVIISFIKIACWMRANSALYG